MAKNSDSNNPLNSITNENTLKRAKEQTALIAKLVDSFYKNLSDTNAIVKMYKDPLKTMASSLEQTAGKVKLSDKEITKVQESLSKLNANDIKNLGDVPKLLEKVIGEVLPKNAAGATKDFISKSLEPMKTLEKTIQTEIEARNKLNTKIEQQSKTISSDTEEMNKMRASIKSLTGTCNNFRDTIDKNLQKYQKEKGIEAENYATATEKLKKDLETEYKKKIKESEDGAEKLLKSLLAAEDTRDKYLKELQNKNSILKTTKQSYNNVQSQNKHNADMAASYAIKNYLNKNNLVMNKGENTQKLHQALVSGMTQSGGMNQTQINQAIEQQLKGSTHQKQNNKNQQNSFQNSTDVSQAKDNRKTFLDDLLTGIKKIMTKNPIGDLIKVGMLMLGQKFPKVAAALLTGVGTLTALHGVLKVIQGINATIEATTAAILATRMFGANIGGAGYQISRYFKARGIGGLNPFSARNQTYLGKASNLYEGKISQIDRILKGRYSGDNLNPAQMRKVASLRQARSFYRGAANTAKIPVGMANFGKGLLGSGKAMLRGSIPGLIIGAGLEGIDLYSKHKSGQRITGKDWGSAGGGVLGSIAGGAAAGAIAGTIVPGLGNVAGLIIGGIGGILGYFGGRWFGGFIGKKFDKNDATQRAIARDVNAIKNQKDIEIRNNGSPKINSTNIGNPSVDDAGLTDKQRKQAEKDRKEFAKLLNRDIINNDQRQEFLDNLKVGTKEWVTVQSSYRNEYAHSKLGSALKDPNNQGKNKTQIIRSLAESDEANKYAIQRMAQFLKTEKALLRGNTTNPVKILDPSQIISTTDLFSKSPEYIAQLAASRTGAYEALQDKSGYWTVARSSFAQYSGNKQGKSENGDVLFAQLGAQDQLKYLVDAGYLPKGFEITSALRSGKSGHEGHATGTEFDITYANAALRELARKGLARAYRDGVLGGKDGYLDEYLHPSKGSTGGHFHIQTRSSVAGLAKEVNPEKYSSTTTTADVTRVNQSIEDTERADLWERTGMNSQHRAEKDRTRNLIFSAVDVTGSLGVWGITQLNNKGAAN